MNMEESTQKALEKISEKLGTTTEYLWGVLIKQAPIDAAITIVQGIVIAILGFWLYKIHKRLMKINEFNESAYDKYDELAKIPMVGALCFWCTVVIMWICCIGDIVNGFANPEYWALHKVLSMLK